MGRKAIEANKMNKPITHIPSEILEPIVSKLLFEMTTCIRGDDEYFSKDNMIREMEGVRELVGRLGATHCEFATENYIQKIKALSTDTIVEIYRKVIYED